MYLFASMAAVLALVVAQGEGGLLRPKECLCSCHITC
jgi:hypothetical protein